MQDFASYGYLIGNSARLLNDYGHYSLPSLTAKPLRLRILLQDRRTVVFCGYLALVTRMVDDP